MTATDPGDHERLEEPLRLSTDETADGAVVRVTGEVDVSTVPALRDELYRLIARGTTRVTLDLSEMSFIDSSGLGVLVGALKRIRTRERPGDLELRAAQPSTRKLLEVTGLDRVFRLSD